MTQSNDPNPRGTLYSILVQERAAGYLDSVVIGGLDGFLQRHIGELRLPLGELKSYASLSPEERRRWADRVVKVLPVAYTTVRRSRTAGGIEHRRSGDSNKSSPMGPLVLDDDVGLMKGVASRTISKLNRLEIERVADLVYYFPHRYNDYGNVRKINQLSPGYEQTVLVRVVSAEETRSAIGRRLTQAYVP